METPNNSSRYYADPWSREYSFKENNPAPSQPFDDDNNNDVFIEALGYLTEEEIINTLEVILANGYPKESLRRMGKMINRSKRKKFSTTFWVKFLSLLNREG